MIVRGIAFLVLALLIFAVQDAIVKYLTQEYEVVQLLTWRILLVVLLLGTVAVCKLGIRGLLTPNWRPMFLRGFMAFCAFSHYYVALTYIPLGDAATVFMTMPLFVTALSVPLLGEQVGVHRWSAVCIGFIAVVFMLNPGAGLFQPMAVLPLVSALFYSLIPIITRKIDTRESALTIAFYTTVSYALWCLIAAGVVHLWPATPETTGVWALLAQPWPAFDLMGWVWVSLSSILFALGIFCVTTAYRLAPVSVLAPFEYSYLLWAILVSYLLFADAPTLRTWLAGCVIVGSGVYITVRERRRTQVVEPN